MKNKIKKIKILSSYAIKNPYLVKKFLHEMKNNGLNYSIKKIKSKLNALSTLSDKSISFTHTGINLNKIPKISFDNTNEGYADYQENAPLECLVKTVAFYLPQFHPFPENDLWWGKGFTEWTNVTKAKPNFADHYQPHLPIHNGFYDLRLPEVMIEQAKLAKNYGIHGFNFYYYWFDGKILMHKPFEILLNHTEIDINFCITWANENWTRRWDGQESDILIGQNHSHNDSEKFLESLFKYFKDTRYIRVDNKPVLIVYRADIIPNMKETIELWRNQVKKAGFDGIYLICSQTFGIKSPDVFGFDAAMEFPPHTVSSNGINHEVNLTNEDFEGIIFDYNQVVENALKVVEPEYKVYRTSMLSWDNTARKQNNSHIFNNFTLLKYKQWFANTVFNVLNNTKYGKDEKFAFVNAWNEWAEGTHLEPDRKYGYGYLQSTYDILKNIDSKYSQDLHSFPSNNMNDIAVIVHIHYTDIWEEIESYLSNIKIYGFDLYVTLTNTEHNIIEKIIEKYPSAYIKLVENRGRDIMPFIDIYHHVSSLNYKYICKIHSKKSTYRNDGALIRNELYDSLLGSKDIIQNIIQQFEDDETIGLISNKKYLVDHTSHNLTYDRELIYELSRILNLTFKYSIFTAGSMFWFKPSALKNIDKIENSYFEIEKGWADGTVAHSVERLFCNLVEANGFQTKETREVVQKI